MARRLILISVVYLIIGGCLGLYMGVTMKFSLQAVHAHILLAGWLSLAAMGVIYDRYQGLSETRLAKVHFWLHNIGLPIFMIGLASLTTGSTSLLPLAAAGSIAFLLGLIAFSVNVWLVVGRMKSAA